MLANFIKNVFLNKKYNLNATNEFEFSNFHEIAKMLIQEYNGLKCADDYHAVYAFEPRELVCSCQQTTMHCSLILF